MWFTAKIASLGDDLRNGRPADQDSAVNKIRDLTMARGNHEDVLAANILPDLMAAVKNPNSALQVIPNSSYHGHALGSG